MRHGHDIGPLRAERKADWLSPSLVALALALGVTAPVAKAQPAVPDPMVSADVVGAVQALLDQARYWRLNGRPDLVADSMRRVYALAPRDPGVIRQLGAFAVEDGDMAAATGWLAYLRRVAPEDPGIAGLERSVRLGPVPAAGIGEARRLAQSGDAAGALALYRRLFGGGAPPDAYALEYYQTLAGTPDGFDAAQRGLGLLAARDPNGVAGLAYARVLTDREPTRRRGIVLLLQRGDAEARPALRQALLRLAAEPADKPLYDAYMALAPDDGAVAGHFAEATAPAARNGGSTALEALAAAKRARDGGKLAEAERLAAPLAQGQGPLARDALLLLGDVQHRRGNLRAAEATYRAVLDADPEQRDALTALYALLVKQKRNAEAQALAARRPSGESGAVGDIGQAQANALRDRAAKALAAGDLAGARANLEAALANSPDDPWARLDFARLLARGGEYERSRALIDEMVTARDTGPDALYAAALFAAEQGHSEQVLALIARVPERSRTAEMTSLVERAEVEGEIGRARAAALAGDGAGSQTILRALYARAGSLSVEQRGTVATAMMDAGDPALGLTLARQDAQGNLRGPASRYEGHVRVMARAGLDAEALSFLRRLEQAQGIDPDGVARLSAVAASTRGDRLREDGRYAESYDVVARALTVIPDDTELLAALARLYDAGGMQGEAMSVYNRMLALKPDDPDALHGAIGAAIGAGATDKAAAMLAVALAGSPGDPELHMLAARLAQARGDTGTAVEALRNARRLRERQLGQAGTTVDPAATVPAAMPGNPFRRAPAADVAATAVTPTRSPQVVSAPTPRPTLHAAATPERTVPEAPVAAPARPTASAGQTSGGLYLPGGEVRRLQTPPEYTTPVQAPEAVVAPSERPTIVAPAGYPSPTYASPAYAPATGYTPSATAASPY
ncbi:MAG: tetratricopeptide repeat protein, partial [Zavarzinia sp.]|nr:tetratricopeptide repeat protein [Zavarzinia sp.]